MRLGMLDSSAEEEGRMTYRVRSAAERRTEIQANAAALGIDETFISTLVETFYDRVRVHPVLGPVFSDAVEDWDEHLPRMKDFWSSVALNSGRYGGKPVPVHQALTGVGRDDFTIWLGLFEETVRDLASSEQAVTYFMERAQRIAKSLQLAMFGLPSLNDKAPI